MQKREEKVMDLEGKVALITGAGSGIGKAKANHITDTEVWIEDGSSLVKD